MSDMQEELEALAQSQTYNIDISETCWEESHGCLSHHDRVESVPLLESTCGAEGWIF